MDSRACIPPSSFHHKKTKTKKQQKHPGLELPAKEPRRLARGVSRKSLSHSGFCFRWGGP